MSKIVGFICAAVVSCALAIPNLALAATTEKTPNIVVQGTADQLVQVIRNKRSVFKSNPQAFYDDLETVLSPEVVDYDYFTRGVMGRYARQSSDKQRQEFLKQFKVSLLQFYGNALVSFNDQKIEVLPVDPAQKGKSVLPVEMHIITEDGTVYPVVYTMTNKSGSWKVRNVTVNGINIGTLFRNQFSQAVQKYANRANRERLLGNKSADKQPSLDFVITNWPQIMQPPKSNQTEKEGA